MWVDGHVPSENLTDSVWFSFPALGAEHPRGPVALASCGRCCIPLRGSTCVGWKSFEGLEILGMGPQVGPAPPLPLPRREQLWEPPGPTLFPWSGAFDAIQLPWGVCPGLEGLASDFLSSLDVLLLVPGQENGLQKISKGLQVEKLSNGGCMSSCRSTRPRAVPEPGLPPRAPL